MTFVTTTVSVDRRAVSTGDELLLDYRERRAREALEKAELKRQDQAEQFSAENPAGMRIRAWEKVHQLRLPSNPLHPVLQAIATATQLSLDEVRSEQQLRAARASAGL